LARSSEEGAEVAEITVVSRVDDLDGKTPAVDTFVHWLGGVAYATDLSRKNARKLEKLLKPFRDNGRVIEPNSYQFTPKPSGSTKRRPGRPKASAVPHPHHRNTVVESSPATIRAWAASNHLDVSSRGRIPEKVRKAFRDAQKTRTSESA